MDLGEKVRALRQQRNLTQPELAEALGIEQSYLSKLENGKSIPSADVLDRILDEFQLEVGDLVDDLDQRFRSQLRHVPVVSRHFDEQKRLLIGDRRRWLIMSTVLLALGASLVYGGQVHLFASDLVYTYESAGVIRDGESRRLFQRGGRSGFRSFPTAAEVSELEERLDEDVMLTGNYRGDYFSIPVEGGSRTYYRIEAQQVDPWQNKAFAALGVLLLVIGVTGILLERKLSRFQ